MAYTKVTVDRRKGNPRMGRPKDKKAWAEFRALESRIKGLPHQKLKALSKFIHTTRNRRFNEGNHESNCELTERGFTSEELQKLLAVIDDDEDRLAILLMATLGLRTIELCRLKGRDLVGDTLRITAAKGSFEATLRIPDKLLEIIPAREPNEPLIGKEAKTLRFRFRKYRDRAGLGEIYMTTKPCGLRMVRNRRYRLSLHSLRHYAVEQAYETTKDIDLARRLARHKDCATTMKYLKASRKGEVEAIVSGLADGIDFEVKKPKPKKVKAGAEIWGGEEDFKSQVKECMREHAIAEKKALKVYKRALNECENPEAYWEALALKWLRSPRYKAQRRVLGVLTYAMVKHPDKLTDDWESIDLPTDICQNIVSIFYDIKNAGKEPLSARNGACAEGG